MPQMCIFRSTAFSRNRRWAIFSIEKQTDHSLCPTSLWDKHLAITSANLNSAIIAARAVAVAVVASPRHSIHSESLISVIQDVKKKAERKKKKFWMRVPNCFLLFIPDANSVIDPASRLCGWRLTRISFWIFKQFYQALLLTTSLCASPKVILLWYGVYVPPPIGAYDLQNTNPLHVGRSPTYSVPTHN